MQITELLKTEIKKAISDLYNLDLDSVHIEHPENMEFGDYSTNVAMVLAKQLKQSPMVIAENVCYKMQESGFLDLRNSDNAQIFESVNFLKPGFINFVLHDGWLKSVLNSITSFGESYGSSKIGDSEVVLIEYSQPNPNKPLHIGHARNNFLGSSLINIYKFLGYKVIAANYMNDWGTHICKSMLMYKKFHEGEVPNIKPDHYVGKLYIEYEQREQEEPELKDEVANMFQKMESGDEETLALWKKITGWAYEGWEQTYSDQGVYFDTWFYQSDYKDSGKEVVKKALEQGIAEKDESGAVIARLEKYDIPDKVLLRSDGTSVYATQDLQLANDGYEKFKYAKRLYVVDFRQSDYFKQIFKISSILGFEFADKLFHVSYGTVELPEGKMSSRKGLVVNSDDVFNEILTLERAEVEKSIKDISEENLIKTTNKVALGAFRFGMLKFDPKQDIVFELDLVTKFSGKTGPYVMYTYARANSILAKYSGGLDFEINYKKVELNTLEKDILRLLYQLEEVVVKSSEEFSTHHIASFVFEIAQKFNSFYSQINILSEEDEDTKLFRLHLCKSVGQVIKNSLHLLGIQVVDKM